MEIIPCHILIAGSTPAFRGRLRGILRLAEYVKSGISLVLFEALDMDDFEKEIDRNTDMVLIDASIVIKERKRLGRAWKRIRAECALALLFTNSNEEALKNVLHEMGRQDSLPLDIHILKDTYPDDLLSYVLGRMLEQKRAEKNLAVV